MGILSIITWTPVVGLVLIMLLPRQQVRAIQAVALLSASAAFALSWNLLFRFDQTSHALQRGVGAGQGVGQPAPHVSHSCE